MNALPNFSMIAFLKLGSVTETSKNQASFLSLISSANYKEIIDARIILSLPKLGPSIDGSLLTGDKLRILELLFIKLSLYIGKGLNILFLNFL
jgi:hypothetical protein